MYGLFAFIFLPILTGLIIYVVKPKRKIVFTLVIQLFLVGLLIYWKVPLVPRELALSSIPIPFGMSLMVDRLSYLFLLLNNILFAFMTVFNRDKHYMDPLFLFIFLGLQGLINGLFLSTDLFNAYLLIEVSTVSVSILIMYKRDSRSMYDGMIYLLVNIFAMAFFLMGIGYLYRQFGLLDFKHLTIAIANTPNTKTLLLPFAFILTGVSLKAALMPLFSWLPKAHGTPSAPSIVSAVLSGIFVKTGIYFLIRVQSIFSTLNISEVFWVMGVITAVLGFTFAIAQKDIKLILAYSTISQVGLILMGISGQSAAREAGGLYHIFNHGIFKALLFLVAGLLIEFYHTRNITQMHSLWKRSKTLSIVLVIAILSITGAPFFSGGYSKYYIGYGYEGYGLKLLMQFISLGTLLYYIKFLKVLLPQKAKQNVTEAPLPITGLLSTGNRLTLLGLSLFCLGFGLFGNTTMLWLTGYQGHLSMLEQIMKLPNYLALLGISIGLYALGFHNSVVIRVFRAFDLGFNAICGTVVIYFISMLGLLNFLFA